MENQEGNENEKSDTSDEKPKEFESRIPRRAPEKKGKDAIKVKCILITSFVIKGTVWTLEN